MAKNNPTTKTAAEEKSITKRQDDYSQWYLDIIDVAELADNSPVRGCMVIKPYGFALWEKIKETLDGMIKDTGVENAYFPLFIPVSFLTKEAKHVEGFAPECAVITHHRLKMNAEGKLEPDGKLEEPLIVRPTSETIMYDTYSRWIKSYRDLPLLINQWANVVRWEMRTRPFLRTMEFLWQEGHTVHATKEEADERTMQMLGVYKKFVEEYLAIPVITGRKTEAEKFAGADYTTCIESLMQDGKALQTGTSHMLGQNFSKAFKIKYLDQEGKEIFAWQTSWGVSTRLIGALIMAHSDDKGLVLPPKIAPLPVVIVPIWTDENAKTEVVKVAADLAKELTKKLGIKVKVDDRDLRPGPRFYHWEKKGVPLRLEIGKKEISAGTIVVVRRDNGEKEIVALDNLAEYIDKTLEAMQKNIFDRAYKFREDHSTEVNSWQEFVDTLENKGGFVWAHWCGQSDCEKKIQDQTKATIRCIPFDAKKEKGACILCGQTSDQKVPFAKAY